MINCVNEKPKKLSKSDKIDKDQEARDRESLLGPKVYSKHFTVGSRVRYDGRTYTVRKYYESPRGVSLIDVETDSLLFLFDPPFMQGHDLSIFEEQK